MNTLEKSLDPEIFLRIHGSIIVNLGRIKNVHSGAHGEYVITLRTEHARNAGEPIRAG
jgi:two-component system, LytTR family, response regulator